MKVCGDICRSFGFGVMSWDYLRGNSRAAL
jgi:hypothetical protein